ncbi:GAF domain-containing protein [Flavobacterium agricola]|uniref:GAF domain-containing protein n=1 Tax=Flavobacterium agricola TaxID=2870839 RepID=A0ABY6M4R9_9FLAO|nr:GAF domain-containing protein [Flavobacterium agricola]UYW02213.1 GAF domain-containing protein [Flavobacterium agricola]
MKTQLLDITNDINVGVYGLDVQLSFTPFITYLENRIESASVVKKDIFKQTVAKIKANPYINDTIDLENINHFKDDLEWIYSVLQPPLECEETAFWAMGLVIEPIVFYGTNAFYDLLHSKARLFDNCSSLKDRRKQLIKKKMLLCYTLILENLYHYDVSNKTDFSQTVFVEKNGLPKYYRFHIDTRFVEVQAKQPLPKINLSAIANEMQKENFDWEKGLQQLPLNLFTFKGFCITSAEDVTAEQSVENIKNLALNQRSCAANDNEEIVRSLKSLMGSNAIEFGLLPNFKINGRTVFPGETDFNTNPGSAATNIRQGFHVLLDELLKNPETLIFEGEVIDEKYEFIAEYLKRTNIQSYALLPIFHSSNIVGVLEIYSMQKEQLFTGRLGELRAVLPTLAQLLKNSIDDFNYKIDNIIKNNFTALQPAVRWKFNEIAWHYLQKDSGKSKIIEDIKFTNVYPLFGVVDVKDSTIMRNKALVQDLVFQLTALANLLESAKSETGIIVLDEILFRTREWLASVNAYFNDNDAVLLNEFLDQEVLPLLKEVVLNENSQLETDLKNYLQLVTPATGAAYKNRRAFENSMKAVNNLINTHLEVLNSELQETFPAYFEKFRTDGVEYDLYIGQSITPSKKFNQLYLKNIRLKQLNSMAEITKATQNIAFDSEYALQTTQLIFVRSLPIDISFRVDERKFDVDGSYNIRYHIIKKRIDKVHIKNSIQRLTQPEKIAIVYYNKSEETEYKEYVKYLQKQGVLKDDLEFLELEDLQGVSGLKALRVGVVLD